MADEIYMDTDAVAVIASGFNTAAQTLTAISKAVEVLMNTLRAVAFMGLVGGHAVERYLAWLKPKIDDLAEYCEEISSDLKTAIQMYINGDKQGSTRFY